MLPFHAFVLALVLGLAGQDGVSAVRAPVILVPGKLTRSRTCLSEIVVALVVCLSQAPCAYLIGKVAADTESKADEREMHAGLAGSVLEEKLNRTSTPSFYCSKESDWQVIWLSLTSASRPNCMLDELAVFYNQTEHRYAPELSYCWAFAKDCKTV